jgi:hypothetical protein
LEQIQVCDHLTKGVGKYPQFEYIVRFSLTSLTEGMVAPGEGCHNICAPMGRFVLRAKAGQRHMSRVPTGESRRSTRVPLKVVITAQGASEPLVCDGETIVVNRHGALIRCTVPLPLDLKIEIKVIITNKRAGAKVVYVDPERPLVCGIELDQPENIWGIAIPPDDWYEREK